MVVKLPMIRRWTAIACALALTAGTLAACGSSNDSSSTSSGSDTTPSSSSSGSSSASSGSGTATDLTLSADESSGLSFTKKTLTAKAGTVTITMTNPSGDQQPHAIAVEGNGVDKDGETVQPGGTSTVTVKLKPGTYTFYCPVDGHEDAGMKGTLTVQ
jgi:uncharacterized cupredoxin-like copper-binding protein